MDLSFKEVRRIIKFLKDGKVGVMPTDTIYGILGSVLNPQTVEAIYHLRKRSTDKPMVILISQISDLKKFDIKLTDKQKDFMKKIWPNPVSVVLPNSLDKFKYLHRGKNSLAFRIPKDGMLLQILKRVGPMSAPSANIEGELPSENIDQAKKYFGKKISFYVDGGEIQSKSSTIIELTDNGSFTTLREGNFKLSKEQQSQM